MLPNRTGVPGAQRHADSDFPTPQRGARDKQIRHVHARDEQHADPGPEHGEEQGVSLLASFLPARRVAKIDPALALTVE